MYTVKKVHGFDRAHHGHEQSRTGQSRHFGKPNFSGSFRANKFRNENEGGAKPSYFRSQSGNNFRNNSHRRGFKEKIDISKFVQKARIDTTDKKTEIKNNFADFAFCDQIKTNLKKRNYATPTPIQDQAINSILVGRDLIGLANTGTGKTAAFLLPLIDKVFKDKTQKVLIIAPTRELALQIDNEFRQFSWSMQIFSAACVGGAPIYKQINNLRRNPNFVIGTPGRLKDLSEKNVILFHTFNNIVIDEIDRMLDMGFVDDIKNIVGQVSRERQSLFFSATMPEKIRDLVGQFLNEPVVVEIKSGKTAENVEADIVKIRNKDTKFSQLREILSQPESKKVLIFSETKRDVDRLTRDLRGDGFRAESIHGDKRQSQRQHALMQFKNSEINILVATDVAARGLDIKDVSHVINYTIPQTYNDYIHRIGRTGRGDKKGMALTFVE